MIMKKVMKENYIILQKLNNSRFRSSFHLKKKDIEYINKLGLDRIKIHAYDFITKRIAPKYIENDGHQTPMRAHPVFVAQHATATCCRNCLFKWHHIEKNKKLNQEEIDYIVSLIMEWIYNEYKRTN